MAGEGEQTGQDEIDDLAQQAQAPGTPTPGASQPDANADATDSESAEIGQSDIELLLNQAQQALSSIDEGGHSLPSGAERFELKDFVGSPASSESATLELMQDVELDLKIELGRTYMQLEDVLRLGKGAVVTLDKLAGDPVDIYVNGRLIARGEVLVLNDNFCVRVAELVVGESACA